MLWLPQNVGNKNKVFRNVSYFVSHTQNARDSLLSKHCNNICLQALNCVSWHLVLGYYCNNALPISTRLCFLRASPFRSLIKLTTAGVKCLCGGWKMSPHTSSLCSYIYLDLRDHGLYVVYIWKYSSSHALGGASVVWYLLLPLMNSLNICEAAAFPCKLCFLITFPFLCLVKPISKWI